MIGIEIVRSASARRPFLLLVCLWFVASCYGATPAHPAMGEDVVPVLASAGTRDEVTHQLGVAPRCLAFVDEVEVCEWRVRARDDSHPSLARPMGVGDRIGVICALPADGTSRDRGSCTFHQRRSNRASFSTAFGRSKKQDGMEEIREQRDERIEQARTRLDQASSALAIVRLVGQLPERCGDLGSADRLCVWVLSNQSYGHGTVAASIGAGMHNKVQLSCRFDADGQRLEDCAATAL